MTNSSSLYLDMMRLLAAILVFCHHFFSPGFADFGFRFPFGDVAVMMFFVISGYVIAYVVETKEKTPRSYFVSRFARLYSVVAPALLLTFILDHIGRAVDAEIYAHIIHDHAIVRMLVSLLYANQIWNFTAIPLSNGPFWSLAYEFWYYALFGAFVFLHGRKRVAVLIAIMLLVGPRILILFPVWLIGVVSYRIARMKVCKGIFWAALFPVAWLLMIGSWTIADPAKPLSDAFEALAHDGYLTVFGIDLFFGGAMRAPSNYAFGLLFALSILSSDAFFAYFRSSVRLESIIRLLSSYTFSIYLYHAPLLYFFVAVTAHEPTSLASNVLLAVLVFGSIALLARYTEHRKGIWRKWFDRLFARLDRRGRLSAYL